LWELETVWRKRRRQRECRKRLRLRKWGNFNIHLRGADFSVTLFFNQLFKRQTDDAAKKTKEGQEKRPSKFNIVYRRVSCPHLNTRYKRSEFWFWLKKW
jgi:hypothetical protein